VRHDPLAPEVHIRRGKFTADEIVDNESCHIAVALGGVVLRPAIIGIDGVGPPASPDRLFELSEGVHDASTLVTEFHHLYSKLLVPVALASSGGTRIEKSGPLLAVRCSPSSGTARMPLGRLGSFGLRHTPEKAERRTGRELVLVEVLDDVRRRMGADHDVPHGLFTEVHDGMRAVWSR
jgi:hypothetical protein